MHVYLLFSFSFRNLSNSKFQLQSPIKFFNKSQFFLNDQIDKDAETKETIECSKSQFIEKNHARKANN